MNCEPFVHQLEHIEEQIKKLIEERWFTKDIKTCNFTNFKTVHTIENVIKNGIITIKMTSNDQNKILKKENLLVKQDHQNLTQLKK